LSFGPLMQTTVTNLFPRFARLINPRSVILGAKLNGMETGLTSQRNGPPRLSRRSVRRTRMMDDSGCLTGTGSASSPPLIVAESLIHPGLWPRAGSLTMSILGLPVSSILN